MPDMASCSALQDWAGKLKDSPSWKMLVDSLCSAASGAAFGAALISAGLHIPEVIVNQFRLHDFRMFQVFSVALGSSILSILASDKLNIAQRQVRPNIPIGLFSRYDGNIIGGALVGFGMSICGSCPGTVMVQIAQGISPAKLTLLGAVVGGMAHIWLSRPSKRKPSRRQHAEPPSRQTISDVTGIPQNAIYAVTAVALATSLFFALQSPQSFPSSPVAGGLYLGLAQIVSLVLTASPLSASGVYDQVGRYAWRALGKRDVAKPPSPPRSIMFALGIMAGSAALTNGPDASTLPSIVSPSSALIGGFAMAFGAKTATGCTSGHGLSGMGALSFSSLITVVSMFGTGILTKLIVS